MVSMALVVGGGLAAAELTLAKDGQPTAVIVLAEKPTKAAQFAAFELQWHVKAISGATLPIAREARAGQVNIHVGDGPRAQALGLTQAALKLQEYAARSGKDELVLVGKDAADFADVKLDPDARGDGSKNTNWPGWWEERGTLHAVYDFLQDACGVRWFNPTDTGSLIPRKPTLAVTVKDLRRAPTFRYRDTGVMCGEERYDQYVSIWGPRMDEGFKAWETLAYSDSRARQQDGLMAKRHNSTLFLLRMRNGGEKCVANHSLYHYYELFWAPSKNEAAAKYFVEKRPELFAQGYQDDPPPQMCYNSERLLAVVVQEARDYFDKGGYPYKATLCNAPLGYKWGENYFCVEPMDNLSFCKCPACASLLAKGAGYGVGEFCSTGIHSDYMFNFVNKVAKEVRKTHPDKHIVTLAYGSHAWPPRDVKLDPGVAVQFCYAFDGSPWWTAPYRDEWRLAEEWGKEARSSGRPLYAWCYYGHGYKGAADAGDFHCFPGFFAHAIAKELAMYKQYGYRGMFHCGMPTDVDSYVLFRLMDNADLDVDAVLDEYFSGLYGGAAPPVKRLYLAIEKVYCDPKLRPTDKSVFPLSSEAAWGYLGTAERMAEFGKLMAEARRLASTEREKRNVELFDLGVWKYMLAGRANYVANTKLNTSIDVACPLGEDLQGFGAANGWRADSGDAGMRTIRSSMHHDGNRWRLRFVEKSLAEAPGPGDRWELVLAGDPDKGTRRLSVDAMGGIRGELWQGGMPQEWTGHGAESTSKTESGAWTTDLSLPLSATPLDKNGQTLVNIRRHSGSGSPDVVLVATDGGFASGAVGARVSFDKPLGGKPRLPPAADMLVDWDFSGTGKVALDRSGHGNDGKIVGEAKRVKAGIEFVGGNQYVEIDGIKGLDPDRHTFTCWLRYAKDKGPDSLLIFFVGSLDGIVSLPCQQLSLRNRNPDKKTVAGSTGPFGQELTPNVWHMFTLTCDGTNFVVYENGRSRAVLEARCYKPTYDAQLWRFGGLPDLPPFWTFIGTMARIQFYNRPLSPEEVMGKYEAERDQISRGTTGIQ